MTSKEIVKLIMKSNGVSQQNLAEMTPFGTQTRITGMLNRSKTMMVANLVTMLDALGYDLVVRDRRKNTDGKYDEWSVTDRVEG